MIKSELVTEIVEQNPRSYEKDCTAVVNPDGAAAQVDPLLHCLAYGMGEGRYLPPRLSPKRTETVG